MKSGLRKVDLTQTRHYEGESEASEDETSEGSETSEASDDELEERVIYRAPAYFDRIEKATTIVIGVDPGPALCGFQVIGEFPVPGTLRKDHEVLGVALYGAPDDGTPLERVARFSNLPWGDWLPMMMKPRRSRVHVLIEKQEQRRGKSFREDNTVLIGVLAAGARLHHVENLKIVSATVKLGQPMLRYCGMPMDTVVPRGAANRLKRKKLAVEVYQAYLQKVRGFAVSVAIDRLPQSGGQFDVCDAGLTALSYFKNRDAEAAPKLGKRKRQNGKNQE